MSSLYTRANARQAHALRIVEGACRDASNKHPEHSICPQMARSVAKRAAGTLMAAWPDVLAGESLSDRGGVIRGTPMQTLDGGVLTPQSVARLSYSNRKPRLFLSISRMIGQARRAGQTERADALIEVLRMMADDATQNARRRAASGAPVTAPILPNLAASENGAASFGGRQV